MFTFLDFDRFDEFFDYFSIKKSYKTRQNKEVIVKVQKGDGKSTFSFGITSPMNKNSSMSSVH